MAAANNWDNTDIVYYLNDNYAESCIGIDNWGEEEMRWFERGKCIRVVKDNHLCKNGRILPTTCFWVDNRTLEDQLQGNCILLGNCLCKMHYKQAVAAQGKFRVPKQILDEWLGEFENLLISEQKSYYPENKMYARRKYIESRMQIQERRLKLPVEDEIAVLKEQNKQILDALEQLNENVSDLISMLK